MATSNDSSPAVPSRTRVLVAGIGNIFFRDDGFGPAVATAMLSSTEPLPDGVRVVDYGIRGLHLAYDVLDGVDALVLVDSVPGDPAPRDAVPRDAARAQGDPGSITVLEVGQDDLGQAEFDAHGMQPVSVLASLGSMGGELPPTYVVGCVPADVSEGMGLSDPVASAVDEGVSVVSELLKKLVDGPLGVAPAAVRGSGG
jgi:hydrogenase maturation protease